MTKYKVRMKQRKTVLLDQSKVGAAQQFKDFWTGKDCGDVWKFMETEIETDLPKERLIGSKIVWTESNRYHTDEWEVLTAERVI